ncbi:MAG TPA: tetratricopeptide repeat protein [Phycisphaerae bacterium]|nr:tetratricopeptide repeat protein [Phycisphaerae bacterium]
MIWAALLLSLVTASTEDQAGRLREALAHYDAAVAMKRGSGVEAQRRYQQALAGFTALANEGVRSSGLYYDIGNTYVHLGDAGRAIVNYRRALRLDPGNEKVRKNLEVARQMCQARISRPAASAFVETLLFWHFGTALKSRLQVAIVTYAAFWVVMLIGLFGKSANSALRWTSVVLAGLCLVVSASVAWDMFAASKRVEGVIVTDQVMLRKGNGDYYDPQFERALPAGVEFRVLEARDDVKGASWYHVELPDGKDGWLRADQADLV